MGKYFEHSQEIKKQIESDANLVGRLREYCESDVKDTFERIGAGCLNSILRIGKLESGLWVALRSITYQGDLEDDSYFLKIYESYCMESERLSEEGKKYLDFVWDYLIELLQFY